jgi:hypothetical protein
MTDHGNLDFQLWQAANERRCLSAKLAAPPTWTRSCTAITSRAPDGCKIAGAHAPIASIVPRVCFILII